MATKKQLAWRKKFAAMAKARSKAAKKKKRKAKISGTTSIKIPTKHKNKTVHLKRSQSGKFTSIGEINSLQNVILKKLEYDYGDEQVKLLKAVTKRDKNKVRKKIADIKKRMNKVRKMKPY